MKYYSISDEMHKKITLIDDIITMATPSDIVEKFGEEVVRVKLQDYEIKTGLINSLIFTINVLESSLAEQEDRINYLVKRVTQLENKL